MQKNQTFVFRHAGVWRTLTVVSAGLLALTVMLSNLAATYASVINQALGISAERDNVLTGENALYETSYSTLEELYQDKVQLMREIGQEGTILLKNENNALPLGGGKVAVLGEEKGFIYQTSTAGGRMNIDEELATSLVDGLAYHDITVTDSVSGLGANDTVIVVIGRAYGEAIDASKPDAEIVMSDQLSLKEEEAELIETAMASNAGNVILLVSGDYSIEIGDYANDDRISAIVKFGNAGYRGGMGLADVLVGEISPSGHLVETWAYDNMSAPASLNTGDFTYINSSEIKLNQANKYVIYQEGIYTDYRYYETRYEDSVLGQGNADGDAGICESEAGWKYSSEVLYPYGYGLSYTTFTQTIDSVIYDATEDVWIVTVTVTNTGDVSGKDVVQVYSQSPYTDYDKEYLVEKSSVQLQGFAKTDTLEPGASETVEVSIHQQWLASYDTNGAGGYILEAGDYYLALGNGAHEAVNNILAAKGYTTENGMSAEGDASLTIMISPSLAEGTDAEHPDTETYRTVYTDEKVTNAFSDSDINYYLDDADEISYLSRADWQDTYPVSLTGITATDEMVELLNTKYRYKSGASDTEERAEVDETVNYSRGTDPGEYHVYDLMGLDYDDPVWEKLLDNMSIEEMAYMVANGRYTIPSAVSVSFPEAGGNDNPTGLWNQYIYSSVNEDGTTEELGSLVLDDGLGNTTEASELLASMFASEPVLAATFNTDLAARQGEMYAEDALWCGVTFIWGLGVNLHRSPYGGRASEYFSADAVHAALMGSALNTAAADKGCIVVAKHLIANEQEKNRNGVGTWLTEQPLREIYLRAFEGISVYGNMRGVMTSFNRLGIECSAAEYDLVTGVLRNEWGYDGYTITDLYSATAGLYVGEDIIAAGTNIILGTSYDLDSGLREVTSLNVENVTSDPVLLTAVRESAHRLMYVFLSSNVMNGMTSDTVLKVTDPFYQSLLLDIKIAFIVLLVCSGSLTVLSEILKRKKERGKKG